MSLADGGAVGDRSLVSGCDGGRPDGDATVLAPAGRTVSVRSLPEDPGSATGIRPGGIAKTSVAIDLAALGKQPAVLIVDEAGS
jgi:hypothetical protein